MFIHTLFIYTCVDIQWYIHMYVHNDEHVLPTLPNLQFCES